MKNLILSCILLLCFSINFQCKNKSAETPSTEKPVMEKVDNTGPEFTSKYICPMHCKGSGSDTTGICPACGMDYELNEAYHDTK